MGNIFIISDTHFGHDNMYGFKDQYGNPARFPYTSAAECDEYMVAAWNAVVKPDDRVYHLGDVAIRRQSIATMAKLNGTKVLIRGNHDIFELKEYTPFFKDVRGTHKLGSFILSHYPLHETGCNFEGWCEGNIHGHVHLRTLNDPRYFNACVEVINYTPKPFEEIEAEILQRQKI